MSDHLRIYNGDTLKVVALDKDKGFLLKNGTCGALTPDDCPDIEFRLQYVQGGWQAQACGGVYFKGKPVTTATVHNGDLFVLNKEKHLAVQFIRHDDASPVQLTLAGLTSLEIGRSSTCTLQLANPRVSSTHARLYTADGVWRVCDMGSANGVWCNGRRIKDCELCNGDALAIGPYDLIWKDGGLTVYGEANGVQFHPKADHAGPARKRTARSNIKAKPGKVTPEPYPYFTRSPRLLQDCPRADIEIEAAPSLGTKPQTNWVAILLPISVTLAASLALTLFTGGAGMLFSVPMMLGGVLVTVYNHNRQKKEYDARGERLRERYREYIKGCEDQLARAAAAQRSAALHDAPDPSDCLALARTRGRRLWERTTGDADFLCLRVGLGEAPLNAEIHTPKIGFVFEEDAFTRTPQQLADQYRVVRGLPVICDLRRYSSLGIIGTRAQAMAMVRTLLVQAAAHHGYDELKIVALFPESERNDWQWLRWLPHTFNGNRTLRYLACTPYEATAVLAPVEKELQQCAAAGNGWQSAIPSPHYLFLVAEPALLQNQPVGDFLLRNDPRLGVSCLLLAPGVGQLPNGVVQILEAAGAKSALYLREAAGERRAFAADSLAPADCEAFARALAPVRLPEKNAAQLLPDCVTFLQGYHVRRPDELDLEDYWANARPDQSLSVPIGARANGETFYFDIHEKAHGPHGLVAGKTGSGKSKMVQSWILSMAVQFSPQDVSFILIDFKGTGLLLPFKNLPHLAGSISNLDISINRNLIALKNELLRRETLFHEAGVTDMKGYQNKQRAGLVDEPLPYLFVIIDEYAEFKSQFPDFNGLVNTLFRIGRSMGVHIVLLTQSPSGVVSSHSEDNVKFRWCLSVASPAASKEMLGGHDDAAYITNPGRAYVRVGSDQIFEEIQSFYSGMPYRPDDAGVAAEPVVARIELNGSRTVFRHPDAPQKRKYGEEEIDAVVRHICTYCERRHIPPARRIWQDRMPAHISLPDLLTRTKPGEPGTLRPAVALLDDPSNQVQRPLYLPLDAGHVAVCGVSSSDNTVFLQTVAAALCMQYGPDEVTLYGMDFGGWTLGMFKDFPQVAAIANSNDEEAIPRIAQTLEIELNRRREAFAQQGISNLRLYRKVTGEVLPYLVLLVDKFTDVYSKYPKLEDFFIRLGQEGGSYGVCLVATSSTINGFGFKLKNNIQTKLALQMTDASAYSELVGPTGGLLPEKLPGRGLYLEKHVLEFQTALPAEPDEDGSYLLAIRALGEELTRRWGPRKAKGVAVMPKTIPFGSVAPQKGGLVLGLAQSDLAPVEAELGNPHHLLISCGSGGDGANLVHSLLRQLCADKTARVALWGPAPTDVPGLRLLPDGAAADALLAEMADELNRRQTARQADPAAPLPPWVLVAHGYRAFYEAISHKSAARLKALLLVGAGLGVSLIAADKAAALATLVAYREPVTLLLAEGPAVLLGGKPMDHQALTLELSAMEKNRPFAPEEGLYKTAGGLCRFRVMRAEDETM